MRIGLDNLITLAVVFVLLLFVLKVTSPVRSIWRHITTLGRNNGDPFIGLLALAILCVTTVCIVRVLVNRRR